MILKLFLQTNQEIITVILYYNLHLVFSNVPVVQEKVVVLHVNLSSIIKQLLNLRVFAFNTNALKLKLSILI